MVRPSQARYDLAVRNLTRFVGGPTAQPSDIELRRVTPDLLLDFRAWSLSRMKPVSFNTERRHLSAIFNGAIKHGLMASNPFALVPGAPVPRAAPKAISKASIVAYIDWLGSARQLDQRGRHVDVVPPQWFWRTVLKTFYLTGMRKRQLLGLIWDDLNFDAQTIYLSDASSKTRRGWHIPLPAALAPELQLLRTRTVEATDEQLGRRQVFCLPLFSPRRSTFAHGVMRPDNLDHFFQRLRKAVPLDLPRVSAHRIRHSTATILANSVSNLKVVQEQLGHSSITTTYLYVHPDIESMRTALEAL